MATITYPLPTPTVTPNSLADPQLVAALNALLGFANGGVDFVNLSTALQSQINSGTVGPRGATNIAASESTSSTTYTTLTTPDQVTGLVLPTNGLIEVSYFATWQDSVSLGGSAAIFLNSNQLKIPISSGGVPVVQECSVANRGSDAGATNYPLFTTPYGLDSFANGSAYGGNVTTGQVIGSYWTGTGTISNTGGSVKIFAVAGTYTISVQFKASSGSVTASNRKLWVQVQAFS